MTEHKRNLTDDDIQALADAMEKKMVNRFYSNLGRGVWGIAWKILVVGILAVAAYGSLRGH